MNLDPLLTIAEVSVAFAGFASLVTVVARRDIGTWDGGNLLRFRLMIYMSLSSILFALLPFAFFYFDMPEEQAWRVSGGILGIYLGLYLSSIAPQMRRLVAEGDLNGYVAAISAVLGISTASVQLLALAGVLAASIGTYYIGTLYFLFLSGLSFARLVGLSIPQGNQE